MSHDSDLVSKWKSGDWLLAPLALLGAVAVTASRHRRPAPILSKIWGTMRLPSWIPPAFRL